ncbi:MAG: T9SS type A sorting domain-containing protein [Calditrichaceae bacterium]
MQLNADTTDGYVNAWGNESLRLGSDFTIEAWIYPTGPGVDSIWGGIIVNREGEYEIARMPDGTIQWAINNSSPGWTWIKTQYEAPENQWVHLAIVYDQSEVKAYFNGVLFASYPANGVIGDFYSNLNNFQIGARQFDINQSFQGFIDEVRVWNRTRTASEIYSTFNDTLNSAYYATSDSGLIGYWRLDNAEDTGEGVLVSKDLSVNGNDGWLYGDTKLSSLPTAIPHENLTTPQNFTLDQNYPNPFNPVTTIHYRLAKSANVKLIVYNMLGQKIRTLVDGNQLSGNYTVKWNGSNEFGQQAASGVYIYRMIVNGKSLENRKMILMR